MKAGKRLTGRLLKKVKTYRRTDHIRINEIALEYRCGNAKSCKVCQVVD